MYLSSTQATNPGISPFSTSWIMAIFFGEEMTTVEAPACLCRQLSFPSRSISNPWTSCLIVAIRDPFPVSPQTNFSIRNALPLSDLPTIDTTGIMATLQGV